MKIKEFGAPGGMACPWRPNPYLLPYPDPPMTSIGRRRHKLQREMATPPGQFITLQPFNARKEALSCYDLVLGQCECSLRQSCVCI